MRWLEETINRWVFWVTNADAVKAEIERARVLVTEDKLDEAVALLKELKASNPSESSQGLIKIYEQELRDEKADEVNKLIRADQYDRLVSLFDSAVFYEKMPSLVEYMSKHAAPLRKPA